MTDDIKQSKDKEEPKIDDLAAAGANKGEELESLSSDNDDLKANDYSPSNTNAKAQGVKVETSDVSQKAGKQRNDSMIAIVIAIVIAVVIIGLAFAVYVTESSSSDGDASTTESTSQDNQAQDAENANTQPAEPIEDPQEVEDDTQSLIDDIDALDDEGEFGDDELSDDTLGL